MTNCSWWFFLLMKTQSESGSVCLSEEHSTCETVWTVLKYTGNADGTHYKQLSAIQWLDTESHSASITKNELSWCNVLQKECLFTLLTSSSILLLILLSIVSLFSGVKSNFNMFHRVFFVLKCVSRWSPRYLQQTKSTNEVTWTWSDNNKYSDPLLK